MSGPTIRSRCCSPTTSVLLVTSGDPSRRTGGNLYDARIVRALRGAGLRVRVASVSDPREMRRAVSDARPGVVLIDSIAFEVAASALSALVRPRVVALAHMRVRGPSARAILRRADRTIAVSVSLARELRALGARRVTVLAPGCDGVPRVPRAHDAGALAVLCVAHWSRTKGVDVLLAAAAHVAGVRIDLVGDVSGGRYASLLRDRTAREGVVVHGPLAPRMLALRYARADVVCVPSREEGYGIVAAEAIARGIPVIASDLPSLRGIVGTAGALVPPGSVPALARAMAVARDRRTRGVWARRARRRARRLVRWHETEQAVVSLLVAELHASVSGGDRMPPRGVKSKKRTRQYEHIKKSEMKRGRSSKTAKRIAAATTNKTRRRKGETKSSRTRKKS